MALALPKTNVIEDKRPPLKRPEVITAQNPVTVDTKYEPRRHLLTHVAGAKWLVVYYKQMKTSDEASEAHNASRPAPYQQYIKIENFELRVDQPLSSSTDPETSTHIVSGTSTIYPSIVPDHGDTFIADIGDGRSAIFNIREVTPKSYLKDTVYEVEYDLVDYATVELVKALDDKVVKDTYYERSYADYGANPVLAKEEHGIFKQIVKWQEGIARHYFDSFYSQEYNTFLVPSQTKVIYDPFLVEFLQKLWTVAELPLMQHLKVYNRDTADNYHVRTIWDVIVKNDIYMLPKCKSRFGAFPKRMFPTNHPGLAGIRYSRLDYIYHPYTDKQGQGNITLDGVGEAILGDYYSDYSTNREFTMAITKLPGLGFVHHALRENLPIEDAKKYGSFDTYVLSPAFYQNNRAEMSKVEHLLRNSLEEKPVNAKDLLPILLDVINWGEVERFYYIPLLVALSRTALGDLSQ